MKTEISIQGNIIPLPKDFSMHFEILSPVCSFDRIPYSGSLDFSLPVNKINSSILGHLERFTKYRSDNDQRFPGFEVRHEGVLLFSGTLIVNDVTGGNYNLSAIDEAGTLSEAQQQATILEIAKFSDPVDWSDALDYENEANSPYICLPLTNKNYFDGRGVQVKRTTEIDDPDRPGEHKDEETSIEVLKFLFEKQRLSRVNSIDFTAPGIGTVKAISGEIDLTYLDQNSNSYENCDISVVSPFFYLNYIIREALRENKFNSLVSILDTDTILKKLCIYNNYDVTATEYSIEEEQLTFENSWAEDEYMLTHDYLSTGKQVTKYIRSYLETFVPKNHLPKMKMGDLLLSTQNLLNLVFDFLPNRHYNIYSREDLITGEAIDISKYFTGKWVPGQKKKVAINFKRTHDDNDLIFSEGYKDLSDRRTDIKATVATFAALQALTLNSEGDIRFVTAQSAFYEYKWITQTQVNSTTKEETTIDLLGWEKMTIGLQDGWYEYGRTEVETIETSWSTLWNISGFAVTQQPGNMDGWKMKQQPFSPRLHFINNGSDEAGFSMEYEKPGIGIIAKCWKNTAPWWANRLPVTGGLMVPTNVLRYLIFNKCKKYRTEEGSVMIDRFSFDLGVNSFSELEVTAFKV